MSDARRRDEWDRTAAQMTLFYNANRAKDKPAIKNPDEFNPCVKKAPKGPDRPEDFWATLKSWTKKG